MTTLFQALWIHLRRASEMLKNLSEVTQVIFTADIRIRWSKNLGSFLYLCSLKIFQHAAAKNLAKLHHGIAALASSLAKKPAGNFSRH